MCLPRHCQHYLLCGKLVNLCHLWLVVTGGGLLKEMRKWQQGRHCFITGTSFETSPCSCAIWPVRGVASRSVLTRFPRHLSLFLGSNPRWALGAHSSKEGDPDTSRREHQESPSESTTETPCGDSQETGGRPGGRSLWQPHLCHRQLVAGPPPPSSVSLPAWPVTTSYNEASPDSGQVKSFLMFSEARGWNTCWVHSFIPQPAEKHSQQELRIKKVRVKVNVLLLNKKETGHKRFM